MKHTKEPWRIGRFTRPASYEEVRETCGDMDVVADTDDGPYVLAGCNTNFPDDARANARRIVACVNACDGIPNEVLELDQPQFVAMLKQRAELLEALQGVLPFLTGHYWPGVEADAAVDRAVAIVRKAEACATAPEGHNA